MRASPFYLQSTFFSSLSLSLSVCPLFIPNISASVLFTCIANSYLLTPTLVALIEVINAQEPRKDVRVSNKQSFNCNRK